MNWVKIINPLIKNYGGQSLFFPFGILMEGNTNAANIIGGSINNCDRCIAIKNHTNDIRIALGVLIDGVAFQSYNTAISVSGNGNSPLGGLRIVNNRFEDGHEVLNITSVVHETGDFEEPTYLAGNLLLCNSGEYLIKPENLPITVWDFGPKNRIGNSATLYRGIHIKDGALTLDPVDVEPDPPSTGFVLYCYGDQLKAKAYNGHVEVLAGTS